jgi:hypothetical protein
VSLSCDDVRNLIEPSGAALPLSEEQAEQVAEHLDLCGACEERLGRRLGEALERLPVSAGPSLPAVRELIRKDLRRSTLLRLGALAAAALALAGTGWALLQHGPAPSGATADRRPPVEAPLPDPPKVADLNASDQSIIRSEGVLALYLQFCLTCINDPNEQDKQEYLTRSLLIFREVRGRLRSAFGRQPTPTTEAVTQEALSDALGMVQTSKLPSVNFLPTRILAFRFPAPDLWQVEHFLANRNFRLTLHSMPDYLNFAYLKTALGASDAQMARIEEALWSTFVALPKRIEDKDPTIAPKSLESVLPLLSPRQQAIYRKLVGTP